MNHLTSSKMLSSCIAHVSYYKIGTKYMPIIGRLRYVPHFQRQLLNKCLTYLEGFVKE